jgi:nucleotide-binding universal stress UspA family protein
MYSHILIPTDGSELASKGLDHGLSLARQLGSRVTILYVSEPPPHLVGTEFRAAPVIPVEEHRERVIREADEILGEARKVAEKKGLTIETVHSERSPPAEAIVQTANDSGCDLVVMASHGRRGLRRMLLGSQTLETVTNSQVPVLVVR